MASSYYIQCGRNILRQITKESTRLWCCSDRTVNPLLYVAQGLRYRKPRKSSKVTHKDFETCFYFKPEDSDEECVVPDDTKNRVYLGIPRGLRRHYLCPKLLPVPNTDEYAHLNWEQPQIHLHQPELPEMVKLLQEVQEYEMKEYLIAAQRLQNNKLVLRREVHEGDSKFSPPVTKDEIVSEVARQLCVYIEPPNLVFTSHEHLGEFIVWLQFPRGFPLPEGKPCWTLRVEVVRI